MTCFPKIYCLQTGVKEKDYQQWWWENLGHADPGVTLVEGLHTFKFAQDQENHRLEIISNQSFVCIMLEYYSACN